TLDQEIHGGSFWRFFQSLCHSAFKGTNKLRTNGLTLGLWVGDTGKLRQESLSLMRGDQLRASRRHEVLFNLLTLASAQQAVVDEYTGQPVADSALHQSCSNRGVDAAGETTNGSAVGADLGADIIGKPRRNNSRSPGLLYACHLGQEANQHFLAMRRVHNLWVVLHTSHLLSDAFHRRDRSTSRRCSHGEALRCLVHGITVGHPDLVACFQTFV